MLHQAGAAKGISFPFTASPSDAWVNRPWGREGPGSGPLGGPRVNRPWGRESKALRGDSPFEIAPLKSFEGRNKTCPEGARKCSDRYGVGPAPLGTPRSWRELSALCRDLIISRARTEWARRRAERAGPTLWVFLFLARVIPCPAARHIGCFCFF